VGGRPQDRGGHLRSCFTGTISGPGASQEPSAGKRPKGRTTEDRTPHEEGDEPDPRWSLANERTLLAYVRTALALVVAGLAVAASHEVADTPVWMAALGLPLMVLGVLISLSARTRFFATRRALRLGEPLPVPSVASMLPWAIAVIGTACAAVAAVALASR